ncbi:MAG: uracil-DNA glycosylase [Kiritimatiellaeota bacterium]|nr:uracil-DNA glycosylase [Kiritimatiellota bacterium]
MLKKTPGDDDKVALWEAYRARKPDAQLLADVIDLLRGERDRGRRTLDLDERTLALLFDAPPTRPPAPRPAPRPTERRFRPESSGPATQPRREDAAPAASTLAGGPVSEATWEQLEAAVAACRKCLLARARTRTVFGEGDCDADLMFIGEGPGVDEDRQGRPFVGAAGQLLTRMIEAMQFRREDVYIANIVKCHPPGNRNPHPAEAEACLPYLYRQIALVQPKVIVLLGAVPLHFLLGAKGITHCHGQWREFRGIPVMPTFHPAFLLRSPHFKRGAWEDLQAVMLKFGKAPAASRRAARERKGQ